MSMMMMLSKAPHPLTVQAMRRYPSTSNYSIFHYQNNNNISRYYELVLRWKRNFSRLYARRLLTLAAASAASQRVKAQMEAAIEKPTRWKDWQAADWEETAMESLGATKFSRFWMATQRLCNMALLTSPLLLLVPLSYVSPKAHEYSWQYALWGIEQAGPTWIKLVQWATTRQDLFSPEFCQYFGKLQDDTEGHSWEDTQRILQTELGEAGLKALDLDSTPIGSGCIAQVYRGRLTQATQQYPKDTIVAIKVQHPDIWHKVCVDFYILHKAAKWLEAIPYINLEYLSLQDTVRQFRDIMLPQLDLTLEANHLNRFHQDFINDPQVKFPRPLHDLTTTQVLVETFCDGTPIMEYTKPETPVEERQQLARLGLSLTLKMIFLNDFVHGDLHPGNILVSGTYPNLCMNLLDCGLVLEMGPEQHVNLVKVLGAFTRKDGTLAGNLMVDLKTESQASGRDIELFVKGIEQICIMDEDQVRRVVCMCWNVGLVGSLSTT
jgi:aarF domain-containing kinase